MTALVLLLLLLAGRPRAVVAARDPVVWTAGMAIDADGAPDAYGPSWQPGRDALANAGRPGNWWALATDSNGEPLLNDQGYYVSKTALVDSRYPSGDQRRYVDASRVPYLALGRDVLQGYGAALGDLAVAVYKGAWSPAIVADIAPRGHRGEGSIALADALGIPSDPRRGGVSDGVTYLLWPGSRTGWPSDFAPTAAALFDRWGGLSRATEAA